MSRVTLSGAASTARFEGGLGPKGDEGGERGRIRVALSAIDSLGIGRQGFGARRGLPRLSARQSDAFGSAGGSAGRRAPEGAAVAAPSGGLGSPARGNERGTGRRTHYAAPTRPPVCVSGSRTRPTLGGELPAMVPCDDCTGWMYWGSCWIRRRSRATSCRERAMGSVGSSAERRRPLPGPVLLCQPCGGHPLLVRKSSVSYPSVCCVNAWYRRAERGVSLEPAQ